MAIPKQTDVTLPLLKHIASGEEFNVREVVDVLAKEFDVTDEELKLKLNSGTPIFGNRVAWARAYLKMAGLIESPRHGHIRITPEGQKIFPNPPSVIDRHFLLQYPSYAEAIRRSSRKKQKSKTTTDENMEQELPDQTPEELIETAQNQQENTLADDILKRVREVSPANFENLIIKLLEKMGYGHGEDSSKHLGGTNDGGVDGVIEQDALGLDRVYIQAKRYQDESSVGPSAIQAFSGSLNMHRVEKGLFVTSSSFSKGAEEAAKKLTQNIVLIDGNELARLMIEHNVGVRVKSVHKLKAVDEYFFDDL